MDLKRLFNPRSIAIVGASGTDGKVGNTIAKNVLRLGYQGETFLINPKHTQLLGQKCYAKVSQIEKKEVDLVIVVVPAAYVPDVIRDAKDKAKNFVIISAGFGETGEDGKRREREMAELAKTFDLNILGPNCLGFIAPKLNLNASFAGGMPQAGNIALVSQSGALIVAMLDLARRDTSGFSHLISVGNKMQISETELMDFLAADRQTNVIGMYLESIQDGAKFLEMARRVSKTKPVVILKAGKTEKSQKAVASHTGALAGSDAIMDAAFEKFGILRANNFENFVDILRLISQAGSYRDNEKVAILTNAGGPGVLITDAFRGRLLKMADLSDKTKKSLRAFLPEESSVENPVDLLGDAQADRYEKALDTLNKEDVGLIICVLTPQDQTPVDQIAEKIVYFRKRTKKIVAAVFIGGERVRRAVELLRMNGIPNFAYPDRAVEALDKYYHWSQLSKKKAWSADAALNKTRQARTQSIIRRVQKDGRRALYFAESYDLMQLYGINTVKVIQIENGLNDLRTSFPVVLKVDSESVLHKTEKSGVRLNIENMFRLNDAVAEMRRNFPHERLIIQPMLKIQQELILGVKRDPVFGPVVVFGLGGIFTEIFKTAEFLVGQTSLPEIKDRLKNGKLKFLFDGWRGQKPHDLEEIAKIILQLSLLSWECPEISELDINPLLAYNDGTKAIVVDVKIIL